LVLSQAATTELKLPCSRQTGVFYVVRLQFDGCVIFAWSCKRGITHARKYATNATNARTRKPSCR